MVLDTWVHGVGLQQCPVIPAYSTDSQLKLEGAKRGEVMCRVASGPSPGAGQPCLTWPSTAEMCNWFRAPECHVPHVLSQSHAPSCCAVLLFQTNVAYFIFCQSRKGRSPVLQRISFAVGQHWVRRVVRCVLTALLAMCVWCTGGNSCENTGGGGLDLSVACQHNLVHVAQGRQKPGICISLLI